MTARTLYRVERRLAGFSSRRETVGYRKSLAGAKRLAERHAGCGSYAVVIDEATGCTAATVR